MKLQKTINHRAATLTVFACLLAFALGCGGGNGNSSDSTSGKEDAVRALTKAELIKQADSICRKTDERQTASFNAYIQKHPKAEETKAGQEKLVLAAGLSAIQAEIDELTALNPPSRDKAAYEAILDGIDEALASAVDDPLSVLGPAGNPFTAVGHKAGKFGFKACKQPL